MTVSQGASRIAFLICVTLLGWLGQGGLRAESPDSLQEVVNDRTEAYRDQLEGYFRKVLIDEYPERAATAWDRDYSSLDAFIESVKPNRRRWRSVLNPPELVPSGAMTRRPCTSLEEISAEWVTLPLGWLDSEAILVIPSNATGPVPLIIAQHGIGSFPEKVFGLLDDDYLYHN